MQEYQWMEPLLAGGQPPPTDKQLRILLAAVKLFSEQGYAATSTREIAALADVAEGTIFKHYGTKKELMLALCRQLLATVVQPLLGTGLEELLERPYDSFSDFLRALMQNRMGMLDRAIPVMRLLLQELPLHPELQAMMAEAVSQLPLAAMIAHLQREGLVIPMAVPELSKLLLPSLIGFMAAHFILLPQFFSGDLPGEIDRYIDFLDRALGVRPDRP